MEADAQIVNRCIEKNSRNSIGPRSPITIRQVAVSSDGRYLAATMGDVGLMTLTAVWDVESGGQLLLLEGWCAAFVPGTDVLEVLNLTSGGAVRSRASSTMLSVGTRQIVKKLKDYPSSWDGGRRLQSWTSTGRVKLWENDFQTVELRLSAKNIQRLAASRDCEKLATCRYSDVISLWSGESGAKIGELDHTISDNGRFQMIFGFRPDGTLWSANGTSLIVWDTATCEQRGRLELPNDASDRSKLSPDGRYVVLDGLVLGTELLVCDLVALEIVQTIDFRLQGEGLFFSPDSANLYCVGRTGCLQLRLAVGTRRTLSSGEHWAAAACDPFLALGTTGGSVMMLDHHTLEEVGRFQFPHTRPDMPVGG